MKKNTIIYVALAVLLASCTAADDLQEQTGIVSFTTSVSSFEGDETTRTNVAGNAFVQDDKIKLKIICPYSTHTEFGETTYGGSFDAFWLLKWDSASTNWATLTAQDGYDINGDYSPSASPDIYARYLAQATPYVFTAQTWSEEQIFIAGSSTRVEQYSYAFHANPRHPFWDIDACYVIAFRKTAKAYASDGMGSVCCGDDHFARDISGCRSDENAFAFLVLGEVKLVISRFAMRDIGDGRSIWVN